MDARAPVAVAVDLDAPPEDRPAPGHDGKARQNAQLDRTQILDATLGCLHELGYDRTTIRAIATRLGCAVGSIYRYFKDKRALLDAVCQRRFDAVAELAQLGTEPARVCNEYAAVALEQAELYRLMFWLSSVGRAAADEAADAGEQRGEGGEGGEGGALPGVVRRVVDGLTRTLGEEAAEDGWSRLHGAVMLELSHDEVVRRAMGTRVGSVPVPPRVDQPPAERADAEARQDDDAAREAGMAYAGREDVTLL